MKTLILSDLHLGSPLSKDDLQLATLISDKSYDRIILNGDIFDIWEEKDLDTIFAMNYRFVQALKEIMYIKPVIYIYGNHDPKKDKLQKHFLAIHFCNKFSVDDMIIIHGHEFDDLIIKYSWLAKILFYMYWVAERFGLNPQACCRNVLHSISMKREKKYYNDLVFDVEENAAKKYKGEGYKILIMGHTHLPKFVTYTDFVYINSGDWIHNKTYVEIENNTYKLMDLETGEILIHEHIKTTH